jgi:DNA-binding NarL/FixJ family response regulator
MDLCRQLKASGDAGRVVVYSAFAGSTLNVAAVIAGADAVVSKAAAPDDLFAAVRAVARGERVLPGLTPDAVRRVGARLSEDDLPIFAMLLDGTPHGEIAATIGVGRDDLEQRLGSMLAAVARRATRVMR